MLRQVSKRALVTGLLVAVILTTILSAVSIHRAQNIDCLFFVDGTHAYFQRDTKVVAAPNFPRLPVLYVDGQLLLVTAAGSALTLKSRLMTLTVTGESTIRVTAYSSQSGEQVEVLRGKVIAKKAYQTNYNEPDLLRPGEMTMVNRQIDLMEKEKANLTELREWAQKRIHEAHTQCRRVEGPAT